MTPEASLRTSPARGSASTSTVTEHSYIFTADVSASPDHVDHVAVVFLPHPAAPADVIYDSLTEHLDRQPVAHEIWMATHAPYREQLDELLSRDELTRRLDRIVRCFAIDSRGRWGEVPRLSLNPVSGSRQPVEATDAVVDLAVASGLRQQFVASRALLTAHGSHHFGKPGKMHAKYFMRAQPAVARDAHAQFAAAAILRLAASTGAELGVLRRVWVDTSGIVGVAAALAALRALYFPAAPPLLVDSYGGHDGLEECKGRIASDDLVLISSSTSGGLARRVETEAQAKMSHIMTLFYLSSEVPTKPVICDLSKRASTAMDLTRIEPFASYPHDSCPLCHEEREAAVPIEGDGFLPTTGTLTARRILASDTSPELNAFLDLGIGRGAIRVRHGIVGKVRTVATRLGPMLDDPEFVEALAARYDELRGEEPPLDVDIVIHTGSGDSAKLAAALAAKLPAHPPAASIDDGIAKIAEERLGHALVVSAVASSGRTLLSASRSLRVVPSATALRYFVAVAHPETAYAWDLVSSSLRTRSPGVRNAFHVAWTIYRGRGTDGDDPWLQERRLARHLQTSLEEVTSASDVESDAERLNEFLTSRIQTIDEFPRREEPKALFVPSQVGANQTYLPRLNRGFVFWKFAPPEHPTEEQVFWTITSVLQQNRWSETTAKEGGRYMQVSGAGQFFVIEPAMFDRYNDPVIQSAILRAAGQGELDFSNDESRSRYMRELIVDAAEHSGVERGAAITEFLLSLALGRFDAGTGRHLRLSPAELRQTLYELDERKVNLGIYAGALLEYLARRTSLAPLTSGR